MRFSSGADTSTHPESNSADAGLSRRGLVQAFAVGAAAATIPTQAAAQSASTVAEATSADYVRDPTRWGSAEIAALFPGFKHLDMRTKGAIIRLRHGGSGPPLLMLHGHPDNHVLWYRVAARLAQRYHVVCADLRGYGDSSLPEPGPNGVNYSFRVMAEDMIEVMEQLGHRQFYLVGHDRGARLSHRMCLDHPERVMKVSLIDRLPTYHVWTNTSREWALELLALVVPRPAGTVPRDDDQLGARRMVSHEPWRRSGSAICPSRCSTNSSAATRPRRSKARATITAPMRDIDFEMDAADKDKQISDALAHPVGHARRTGDRRISDRMAEIREQSRVRGVVQLRPLSPLGRGRSGLRPLHEILRGVSRVPTKISSNSRERNTR